MIRLYAFNWSWDGWSWFNLGGPTFMIKRTSHSRPIFVWFWNAFNRVTTEGHYWGFGILQIGNRHLFFVGNTGIRAFFLGRTP